jgi:hypothetical protein
VSPDSKPTDHPFAIWWRRWAGAIALVLVVLGGAGGFAKLEHEGNTRETQFCNLIIKGFEEKEDRIDQTRTFLGTPNNQLPQGLVDLKDYIRKVSLPLTIKEFRGEEANIPGVCWKYFQGGE